MASGALLSAASLYYEPRNLESKRCWRFYAQQNVKTMYFKTLNPIYLMLLNDKEASNFLLWDFKNEIFQLAHV